MKVYTYNAKTISGESIKGKLFCDDYQDFLNKINNRGLFCTWFQESDVKDTTKTKRIKTKHLAFCCKQLSTMFSAGVNLIKALDILYKEQPNKHLKQIWLQVYEEVQKGKSFSEALKIQNNAFPAFFLSMVSAGESSGSLDIVMERLAEHYMKETKMDNKIKGALVYPIVLSCLSLVVVIGLFTFVLPKFVELFDESTLPPLTKFTLSLVNWTKNYWYILVLSVITIVILIVFSLKIPEVKTKFDKKILKNRVIGKLMEKIYIGRFARTLASLYSNGIPLIECIERSVAILNNTYIEQCFDEVIDNIKKGEPLSTSILKTEVFNSMFCSIIYVGEESGSLDNILISISSYYDDEAESAIQRLVSMLEPILIIVLGGFVGLIIASILPALYSSLGSIQ